MSQENVEIIRKGLEAVLGACDRVAELRERILSLARGELADGALAGPLCL
jgi:hypothetical protein